MSDCVCSSDADWALNVKVSNVAVKDKTEGHVVYSKVNTNSEQLVELCAEKGQMIRNT